LDEDASPVNKIQEIECYETEEFEEIDELELQKRQDELYSVDSIPSKMKNFLAANENIQIKKTELLYWQLDKESEDQIGEIKIKLSQIQDHNPNQNTVAHEEDDDIKESFIFSP